MTKFFALIAFAVLAGNLLAASIDITPESLKSTVDIHAAYTGAN